MAFMKYAYAQTTHPNVSGGKWNKVRTASGNGPSQSLIHQASEILGEQFDPNNYLLTHATIVCSVDVEPLSDPNVKLGMVRDPSTGQQINRKFAEYRIEPHCDKYINNNCFVPGTLITMADGTVKPIEDVREGDEVLTHRGRTRRVRAIMRREVDEELYEIHPRSTTERIYATGEHPFFVFRENACANCGVPVRSKSSYNARCITHLIGKFYCSRDCWYEKKVRKAQLLGDKTGEFVEARHLTGRDFISTPVVEETHCADLTLGQARLIGLFVAEGYYELDSRNDNERVGAVWAFHSAEAPTLAKTVCDLMRAEFGVECVVRDHKNDLGIHVTTRTNRDAAAFFSRWILGAGSKTKTLHPHLLRSGANVQMEVVRGWMEGDGCFQDTRAEDAVGDVRLTGSTASRSLASQMQIILRRLGISSRLTRTETPGRSRLVIDGEARVVEDNFKPKNVGWVVACGGAWIADLVQETVYEDEYLRAVDRRGGLQQKPALRFLNGYELQTIQSVRRVAYSGPVYNFDVEDDHSYIANGVAVHNCDAWSRPVLMKSYRTFIGGHNFCFAPGTRVMMADGTYRSIEQVCVGDEVITHEGRSRRVTHVFERDYEGDIRAVRFDRFKDPVLVTGNHPFRSVETYVPPTRVRPGTSASNALRYRRDQIARALRGEKNVFGDDFHAEKGWRNAEDLEVGSFVLSPRRVEGTRRKFSEAILLGYYAAEGCPMGTKSGSDGFVLSFGPHEGGVAEDARRHALRVWPDAHVAIRPSQTSLRVEVFASGAREWCIRMGGHLASTKKLDASVFEWDRESLLRLLGAWLTGDGNLHKGTLRLRGSSTSRELADQMHRVAEIVGVKSSVVFERRKIGEVMSSVQMTVGGEVRSFDVIPRHHVWTVLVSKGSVEDVAVRSARWPSLRVARSRKRSEITWWQDCRLHRVASNEPFAYKGKVYNLEVEEDHSYVIEHGIACHNCEHVQKEEESKGRILDAVARDIGDSVYIDILLATHRRHAALVRDIENGTMNTLSMGCSVVETACTKCGNVAADETEMCSHIRFEKGNYFYDNRGKRHRTAELCGHESIEPTAGVQFIEASWVAAPAFAGAVMRNILTPTGMTPEMLHQAQQVLRDPPPQWMEGQAKAATQVQVPGKAGSYYGPDGPGPLLGDYSDLMAFDFGDEGEGEAKPDTPEKQPLDQLEDEIYQMVLDKVEKRVQDQLSGRGDQPSPQEPAHSTGEDIIKQATRTKVYQVGLAAIVKSASSDAHLMNSVARFNASYGVEIPRSLYVAALDLGPLRKYGSIEEWAVAAHTSLNRTPSLGETKTLLRLGKLLDQMAAFTTQH